MKGKAIMSLLSVLVVVGVVPLVVKGGRELKDNHHPTIPTPTPGGDMVGDEKTVPIFGGFGGVRGVIPASPGGSLGGFGGVPSGSGVFGTTVPGVGSSVDFCSIPGLGCVHLDPTNPGGVAGGGATPLPFP